MDQGTTCTWLASSPCPTEHSMLIVRWTGNVWEAEENVSLLARLNVLHSLPNIGNLNPPSARDHKISFKCSYTASSPSLMYSLNADTTSRLELKDTQCALASAKRCWSYISFPRTSLVQKSQLNPEHRDLPWGSETVLLLLQWHQRWAHHPDHSHWRCGQRHCLSARKMEHWQQAQVNN